jgi:hypothetical protein
VDHLTKIAGVPDSAKLKRGMAYFENTGPFGRTCGECIHKGYRRKSSVEQWNDKLQQHIARWYHWSGCAMFKKLAGKHGPEVQKEWAACKYFKEKEE